MLFLLTINNLQNKNKLYFKYIVLVKFFFLSNKDKDNKECTRYIWGTCELWFICYLSVSNILDQHSLMTFDLGFNLCDQVIKQFTHFIVGSRSTSMLICLFLKKRIISVFKNYNRIALSTMKLFFISKVNQRKAIFCSETSLKRHVFQFIKNLRLLSTDNNNEKVDE